MKIVTDCAADMPADELQSLDITQAPLFIRFPEGEEVAMACQVQNASTRPTNSMGPEARRLLSGIYDRFDEGLATADLVAARTLVEQLG